MFRLFTVALPLLQEIDAGVADPKRRQEIEGALASIVHAISRLTPSYTILGKACTAFLTAMSTAEAMAGDPPTP